MKTNVMLKVLAVSTLIGLGSGSLFDAKAVVYNFETPEQIADWSFSGSSGPNAIVNGAGVGGGNALSWSSVYNGPLATTTLSAFTFTSDVDISLQYARSFDNFQLTLSNGSSSATLIHSNFWYGSLANNNDPVWNVDGSFNSIALTVRSGVLNAEVNGTAISLNRDVAAVFDGSPVTLSFTIWGGSDTVGGTPEQGYLDNVTVNPVPEPSTLSFIALFAGGMIFVGLSKRRRLAIK